jgi:hypothetical protein
MERYTATHVDGRVRAAATVAAFCSAGALAAGALITAVDDEAPLELHWLGRNLLWWMGAAGAAFVAATSALPDESATPVDFETDVAPHLGGVASANAAYAARHFCHVLVLLARNVAALLLLPWFVAGPLPRVVVGVHRAAWQEQVVALPSTASHPPPPRHQSVVRPLRV